MSIFDLIGGAAKAVGGLVGEVFSGIDSISTTEEEKQILKARVMEAQQQFEVEIARLAAQAEAERAQTVRAEIASDHWLAANWRPIVALAFAGVVLYAGIFASMFGLPPVDMEGIPRQFWTLLVVMVGGYTGLRSAEKIIPQTKWAKDE